MAARFSTRIFSWDIITGRKPLPVNVSAGASLKAKNKMQNAVYHNPEIGVIGPNKDRKLMSEIREKILESWATPKEINRNDFMGSVFKNCECETILRNIVMLQQEANPDKWTPFSWDEYKAFCTHNVTDSERGVLDAFVHGGKPVLRTSAYLDSGWLEYDGIKYSFSLKMVMMLAEHYRV